MSSNSPRNESTHSSTMTESHQAEIYNTYYRSPTREPGKRNLDARDGNVGTMSSRDRTGERHRSVSSGHHDAYANDPKLHHVSPKVAFAESPDGASDKLGTLSGVFVPTTLNVLSILMFLRFGFILGQSGFLGMMGKWIGSSSLSARRMRN